MNVSTHSCVYSGIVSIVCRQGEEIRLTSITAPLISLPQRPLAIDEVDASLSGIILLESTKTVGLMPLANVYSRPKVHEVVDVIAVANH